MRARGQRVPPKPTSETTGERRTSQHRIGCSPYVRLLPFAADSRRGRETSRILPSYSEQLYLVQARIPVTSSSRSVPLLSRIPRVHRTQHAELSQRRQAPRPRVYDGFDIGAEADLEHSSHERPLITSSTKNSSSVFDARAKSGYQLTKDVPRYEPVWQVVNVGREVLASSANLTVTNGGVDTTIDTGDRSQSYMRLVTRFRSRTESIEPRVVSLKWANVGPVASKPFIGSPSGIRSLSPYDAS